MDREVARWLHQHLGYNSASDATLAANCRGNLKGLWEFLIANYKTPEAKRHIQNVLAKHRREQEAARRAPEEQQRAAQQLAQLAQLQAKAAALQRTLASLQAAVDSSIQDTTEQAGEGGLFRQELHECETQALLLQTCTWRVRGLLPLLQAQLSKLRAVAEVASARCQVAGGTRRLQATLQQLQRLSCSIGSELLESLQDGRAGAKPPTGAAAAAAAPDVELRQPDQQQPQQQEGWGAGGLAPGAPAAALEGGWAQLRAPAADAGLQHPAPCSLLSGFSPSDAVCSAALQLLQDPPELILCAAVQLAAQDGQQLAALLDDTEQALLVPAGAAAAGARQAAQGAAAAQDGQADGGGYLLPWTMPCGTAASLQQQQQQHPGCEAAAFQSPELLVKQRQQTHVQLFVQAAAAATAAKAADAELTQLLGATPLLRPGAGAGWEAQLACLWLRAECLRAEVAVLEQRKAECELDVDGCLAAEAALQDKWAAIEARVAEDQEANGLLWQVAAANMDLFAALCGQREQAAGLLRARLAPCAAAAAAAGSAGCGELLREAGALGPLPLAGVVPAAAAVAMACGPPGDAGSLVSQQPTLVRLRLAAQCLSHLGRPTTAHKGRPDAPSGAAQHAAAASGAAGGGGAADSASIAALRALTGIDAVAPARCPAALLMQVAAECWQLQQLQQQLEQLCALCGTVGASSTKAAVQAERLEQTVGALRARDQQQVLPRLQELLELGQQQRALARQEVGADLQHFWDMPAQHLLPDRKYEGKSCSEWLMEIQALHGRKRELSSAAASGKG